MTYEPSVIVECAEEVGDWVVPRTRTQLASTAVGKERLGVECHTSADRFWKDRVEQHNCQHHADGDPCNTAKNADDFTLFPWRAPQKCNGCGESRNKSPEEA